MAFPLNFSYNPSSNVHQLSPGKATIVLVIIGIVGGALTIFLGIPMVMNALESKGWPSVEGIITVSEFTTNRDRDDGSVTYGANVSYNYTVNGVLHTGSNVHFGQYGTSDPSYGQGIVNRYPIGEQIRVYYDPDESSTSVLEHGVDFFEKAVKLRDVLSRSPAYRGQEAIYVVPALAAGVRGIMDAAKDLFEGREIIFWARPVEVINHGSPIPLWASDEVSYIGLKSAWQKLEPYMEELLQEMASAESQAFIAPHERNINWPNSVSRRDINTRIIPFANKEAKENLDHFYDLLRFAIDRNSAKDVVHERYYVNTTHEDQEKRQKFINLIQDLKTRYK